MTPDVQSKEFVALWSKHASQVYAYIFSLVSRRADADDIFQETSAFLFERFSDFEPGTDFCAWACRVAHLKTLESCRSGRLLKHVDESFLDSLADSSRVDQWNDRLDALSECLRGMRPRDRELIELRYRQGADVRSLAERLSCSASLIYQWLDRLHNALFRCVRRRLRDGGSA